LPEGTVGRIGLDLYQKDPNILYAVVDNRNKSTAAPATPPPSGTPAVERLIGGEVYRTDDGGLTWRKTNSARDDVGRKTGYAFNQLRIDPNNPDRVFITGSSITSSEDGGKTWAGLAGPPGNRVFRRAFGDFRTLWIDSQNSDRMMAGSDGGVCASFDGGKTCDHFTNLPLGEVYALTVDMEDPYNVYAGLQDHESWKGPSNGWSGSVGLADWVTCRHRRRHVQSSRSYRQPLGLQHSGVRKAGPLRSADAHPQVDRAHQTCRPTDVAIQLGGAASLVAARS
jgi:hypothetical protein